MGNVHIVSTLQNKLDQKKSVHHSSSTVFLGIVNKELKIDTEISFLNHFLLKRNISDVVAIIEIRTVEGNLFKSFKIKIDEPKTYKIKLSEYVKNNFIGSVYVFFQSKENIAVPFCAVTFAISTNNSVCGVHTYGRRLEQNELGTYIDLKNTIETGWTLRDTENIKSFATLHGGQFDLSLNIRIECLNSSGLVRNISLNKLLKSFGTLMLIPQELDRGLIDHLAGKKGFAKIHIDGLSGIFPRMLCGNFLLSTKSQNNLFQADEIQFTHTNFDFSSISQPDCEGSYGYYNQPNLPKGYGIVYPLQTEKDIFVGNEQYLSNTMQHIEVDSMSQLVIESKNGNMPSRLVCAAIGIWDESIIESECSTGTFIEEYLKVPCRWHWGLLKPSLDNGEIKISIIINKFARDIDLSRKIDLKIYSEDGILINKEIDVKENMIIEVMDLLPRNLPNLNLWYVLSGENLEDLNIFSTFYPRKKSGFTEHAF